MGGEALLRACERKEKDCVTPGEKERERVVLFPRGSCHIRRRRNLLRGITCSARARRKLYTAYSNIFLIKKKKADKTSATCVYKNPQN